MKFKRNFNFSEKKINLENNNDFENSHVLIYKESEFLN
jgi:hypothetical protein